MQILEGKYGEAKVFVDEIDSKSKKQIERLLDQSFVKGSKIRIMPDVHAGMGCVIGFTADMQDKIIPNIVGVDIGCGVLVVKLGDIDIDLDRLNGIIRQNIPIGFNVHKERKQRYPKLRDLHVYRELNDTRRLERSVGTLGGGNHFIEVNEDSKGHKYLQIHSGSRNLGHQVAELYQKKAIAEHKRKNTGVPGDLAYLEGDLAEEYLHDMAICQQYAVDNREEMARTILRELLGTDLEDYDYFHTIHNYINFDDNIVRKGAISAKAGEELIIPINMKDGSILAVGKGNEDWNNSAPHGAGRLMSRREAKRTFNIDEFRDQMEGIYSTTVHKGTLDEIPSAYKDIDVILESLDETAEVIDILKPIFNFKG